MAKKSSTDLSSVLQSVQQRVSSYTSERTELASNLRKIVADAQKLLADLGEAATTVVSGNRRGRPAGSKNKTAGAKKGRRKMSAKARKAISDAQKKRWAAQKAGTK